MLFGLFAQVCKSILHKSMVLNLFNLHTPFNRLEAPLVETHLYRELTKEGGAGEGSQTISYLKDTSLSGLNLVGIHFSWTM